MAEKKKNFFNKNKDEFIKNYNSAIIYIFISALFIVLLMFLLSGENLNIVLKDIFTNPYYFILNYFVSIIVILFIYFIIGRLKISISISYIILGLLYIVNNTKIIYRNDTLKLTDIALGMEALKMAKSSYYPKLIYVLIFLILFLILFLIIRRKHFVKLKVRYRFILFFLTLIISFISYNTLYKSNYFYYKLPMNGNSFNEVDVFKSKGFNYTFVFKSRNAFIKPPENYDKKTYIRKEQAYRGEDIANLKLKDKPNIIWIMGEAFTDMSQNEAFRFAKGDDPNENFKKLTELSTLCGRIVTPSFGGGTGDTEFDVLTGAQTIDSAPDGTYAFNAIKRETKALPSVLASIGYNTRGFHPGYEWFYRRNVVYPRIGFNKSYFLEDIENPVNKGDYLSEEQFSNIFIDRFTKSLDNEEAPIFDYAVDIQNHGPYFYDKYGMTLPFKCKYNISDHAREMWGSYFQGVKDMDTMLGRVYDMMKNRKEPIILVFYGDHLPGLGDNPSGFEETAIKIGWNDISEETSFYSTPFIVVANDAGRAYLNTENIELKKGDVVSANYLASTVLDMLGYTKADNFFMYNSNLRKKLPIISRHFIYDGVSGYPRNKVKNDILNLYDEYKGYEYYRINERKR